MQVEASLPLLAQHLEVLRMGLGEVAVELHTPTLGRPHVRPPPPPQQQQPHALQPHQYGQQPQQQGQQQQRFTATQALPPQQQQQQQRQQQAQRPKQQQQQRQRGRPRSRSPPRASSPPWRTGEVRPPWRGLYGAAPGAAGGGGGGGGASRSVSPSARELHPLPPDDWRADNARTYSPPSVKRSAVRPGGLCVWEEGLRARAEARRGPQTMRAV
eukprot:345313-Chlamydomonas_euryale.AAC.1